MEAPAAVPEFKVKEQFLADHRKLEELFQRVLNAFESGDRDEVAALWTEFDERLSAHMTAEEEFLVPGLMRTNERAARAILEEHRHFRSRLAELAAEVDLHVVRLTTARSLIDELRAHASHEDRALYTWADHALGEGKRASALAALDARGAVSPAAARLPSPKR
jgi:hemerythrin-like domain-containing protein